MAYDFYIDGVLLPVAPGKLSIKNGSQNKTFQLINDGEVNCIKSPSLQEISFGLLLPNVKYPFAVYPGGFQKANFYLDKLEALKTGKRSFQFIISRSLPTGENLNSTNIKVALEDFTVEEDAGEGFDVFVTINLKQYKDYGTKTVHININQKTASVSQPRGDTSDSGGGGGTYIVKKGDCLWKIAQKYYGSGSQYKKIYDANKSIIKNPNLIYPGQVLTIP